MAWRFFRNDTIKQFIIEAVKTWRKRNAAMILATQSSDDLHRSELMSIIVESCVTDNQNIGDLETFLRYLVPDGQEPLWQQACGSVATARENGAACHDSHVAKANLYTWLARQEPPGQRPLPFGLNRGVVSLLRFT